MTSLLVLDQWIISSGRDDVAAGTYSASRQLYVVMQTCSHACLYVVWRVRSCSCSVRLLRTFSLVVFVTVITYTWSISQVKLLCDGVMVYIYSRYSKQYFYFCSTSIMRMLTPRLYFRNVYENSEKMIFSPYIQIISARYSRWYSRCFLFISSLCSLDISARWIRWCMFLSSLFHEASSKVCVWTYI
jgi:hypothetical protein